jgi:hypothetical protein
MHTQTRVLHSLVINHVMLDAVQHGAPWLQDANPTISPDNAYARGQGEARCSCQAIPCSASTAAVSCTASHLSIPLSTLSNCCARCILGQTRCTWRVVVHTQKVCLRACVNAVSLLSDCCAHPCLHMPTCSQHQLQLRHQLQLLQTT